MRQAKTIPRIRLQQVREATVPFATDQIRRPADAYRTMRPYYKGADREILSTLCLDAQSVPTCIHVAAIGGLNTASAKPADVLKAALVSNSFGMVVVHNHPSGTLEPSRDDIEFTRTLKSACQLIGIELFDHLIVTDDGFTSLRERGAL